jgi:class 3 adenylate cyclase
LRRLEKKRNDNIAIIVTTVVAAFALAFALIRVLLHPLVRLARRMQLAAALEDNEAAGALSPMQEVGAIEAAYFAMNNELQRLKGFVPQSVLLQNIHRRRVMLIKARVREAELHPIPWYRCGCCRSVFDEAAAEADELTGVYSSQSEEDDPAAGANLDEHGADRTFDPSARSTSTRPSVSSALSSNGGAARRVRNVRGQKANGDATAAASGGATGAGGSGGALAPGTTTVRLVTAVAVNIVGFHAATLRDGASRLGNVTEALTAVVVAAAAQERGVVDSFHGDHFFLTFNAASSCATHAIRAVKCALHIGQRCSAAFGDLGMRVVAGIASSAARCGSLGCAESRRFSIVGAAVPQAHALEQLVRRHRREGAWRPPAAGSYRIAVAPGMLEELRTQIAFECIDVAPLPVTTTAPNAIPQRRPSQRRHATTAVAPARVALSVVSQVLGELAANPEEDNEWMYAVGDGAGAEGNGKAVRVQHRLGSADATAVRNARALLAGVAPVDSAEVETIESLSGGSQISASCGPTGRQMAASEDYRVPLAESNRVFLLLGDVARLRERGAGVTSATIAVASGQPLGGSRLSVDDSISMQIAAPVADPQLLSGPTAGSMDSHTLRQQQQLTQTLAAKVQEIGAALKQWDSSAAATDVGVGLGPLDPRMAAGGPPIVEIVPVIVGEPIPVSPAAHWAGTIRGLLCTILGLSPRE